MTTGNAKNESNRQATEKQIDNKDNEINTFKDEMKVNLNETQQENKTEQIEYDKKIMEILDEYNSKWETELTLEDITYFRNRNVEFLFVDSNGKYIYDYKQETPAEECIEKGIGDIYSVINKNSNEIIASVGRINGEIENIDSKVVMDYDRKEYFQSDKKIDLTENKKEEEKEEIYETLQKQCEKVIEKQNEEKKQKRQQGGFEPGDN